MRPVQALDVCCPAVHEVTVTVEQFALGLEQSLGCLVAIIHIFTGVTPQRVGS
jgi:hypothetical protein